MSKKFRIPRKIKKKLKGNMLFYPPMKDGSRIQANPRRSQKDYTAWKQGVLSDLWENRTKAEMKARSEAWDKKFRQPCELSEEELLEAVNKVFAPEYRKLAFSVFKRAKDHAVAHDDYTTFCNAWKHTQNGDDCTTTAALSLQFAEDNLMRSKPRVKK